MEPARTTQISLFGAYRLLVGNILVYTFAEQFLRKGLLGVVVQFLMVGMAQVNRKPSCSACSSRLSVVTLECFAVRPVSRPAFLVSPHFSCPANAKKIVSVCSAVGGSALLATVIYDFMQWHVFIISHNRLYSSGSGYKSLLMD